MNEMALAFAEHEARYRARVMHATWGHLAVKRPGVRHPGEIVFTHGAYGSVAVITCEFQDVPDSPWFHAALTEFVDREAAGHPPGSVLRFAGTYALLKNGRGRFSGKVRRVKLPGGRDRP